MNKPPRFPKVKASPSTTPQLRRPCPAQPPQTRAVQPKLAATTQPKPPVAPPVYRPQLVPGVLQRKAAGQQPPPAAQSRPPAPPVYRPQPVPKVLQGKMAPHGQTPGVGPKGNQKHPPAPPAYNRPQAAPKVLQAKTLNGQPTKTTQPGRGPVAPLAFRPQTQSLQTKRGSAPSRPSHVQRRAVTVQPKTNPASPLPTSARAGAQAPRAASGAGVVQMRYFYRFINPQAEPVNNIRPNRVLTQQEYNALINDAEALGQELATHMAGDTGQSPFISLTTDFNLAAQTTDTSPGGLGSIVHNAPNIAIFDIPDNVQTFAMAGENLQASEGEVLVLIPPGRSLSQYLVKTNANIYRGQYWNAANLE